MENNGTFWTEKNAVPNPDVFKKREQIIFKVPRFFENENFAAHTTKIADYLELNSYKNIPDRQQCFQFRKLKKG